MSYQVLARKWRPQGFDEVAGQAHVTTPLRNAIRSGRVGDRREQGVQEALAPTQRPLAPHRRSSPAILHRRRPRRSPGDLTHPPASR